MENDGGNHREDRVLLRRMLRRQPSTGTTKKRSVFRVLNACALLLFIAYGLRSDYKVTRSILDEQLIISEQLLPFFDAVNVSLARGEDTQMYTLSKHEQEHVLVPDETTNVVVSLQDDESKHEHEHEHSVGPDIARNGTGTLCFISCIFGAKVKHADSPRDVRELFSNSTNETASFDFFLFTNLKDLPAPGWTKVVKKDLPYKRFITQSRWAKFMGWRDEALSHCGTIIYFDGYLRPVDNLRKFQELASNISKSESGLVQVRHLGLKRRGIEKLLKRIVKNKKDLPVNVNATLKWLREQPDFHDKITYYLNKYLGKFLLSYIVILLCYRSFALLFHSDVTTID
jgi:hypothetical protein